METNLFRYIWTHTRRQQLWILLVILVSMPAYFLSLDIPKRIVNGPIQGQGFEQAGAQDVFLPIAVPNIFGGGGELVLFPGIPLERMPMLFALSGLFLALVIVNGLFKFYINTYKGRLGERMLRRIRYELIDKVLRFPPGYFKRVKPSEIASMVKDEVEPLGGFIGDAFTQPAFLGGQAATALVFILVQNVWLGLVAAGIVAIQGILIPRLRRRLIELGRQRQLTARALAGRIGEIVDGIQAVHVNDTSNYERAEMAKRLGRIFKIRYDLYQWKFFVKFLNNFLAQVTPFFFYAIGGYLALKGSLDIGQLVAVIAAYKDLPSPIKDLIDWDQARVDVQVKYAQVVEQFSADNILPPSAQPVLRKAPVPLDMGLTVTGLAVSDDSGARLLERTSLKIGAGEKVAIVGTPGGGAEVFAETLARFYAPAAGKITLGTADLFALSEAVAGRRLAYASSDAPLFQGTVRDVLLYALKHAPLAEAAYEGEAARTRAWEVHEAKRSGNPAFDLSSDWIDYASAGAAKPEELGPIVMAALQAVDLKDVILDLGLRSTVDPARNEALCRRLIEARAEFQEKLKEAGLADAIVPFDPDAYNPEATVADNLLFGAASPAFRGVLLASSPPIHQVLSSHQLTEPLLAMGIEIASTVIELFRDLPPIHPFFDQLTFMTAEELPAYQAILQRLQGKTYETAAGRDRDRIVGLSLLYVEPRHRFGLIDDSFQERIVAARADIRASLTGALEGAVEFYDPERYTKSASLLDNILFGRIAQKRADGERQIKAQVRALLDELELTGDVIDVGLDFDVGVAGKRLGMGDRQKIHLARVLLKRPDIAILNKPLNALDGRAQEQIMDATLSWLKSATVIWTLGNPALARRFDRVVVFDRGAPVEDDSHEALLARKGVFAGLVS